MLCSGLDWGGDLGIIIAAIVKWEDLRMGIDSGFIRTVLYLVVLYLFSIGDITMERMRASGGGDDSGS